MLWESVVGLAVGAALGYLAGRCEGWQVGLKVGHHQMPWPCNLQRPHCRAMGGMGEGLIGLTAITDTLQHQLQHQHQHQHSCCTLVLLLLQAPVLV